MVARTKKKKKKKYIYIYIYNMESKLGSFLRKGCFLFCFFFFSRRTAYVVRDNAKKFTSVGLSYIRRRGVVGRVPTFQPAGPGLIPGGVRNFNFCPGIGCVSFICFLSCFVFGGGPVIVLPTHSGRPALVYLSSVLVRRLLLPLQACDPWAFGL